MNDNFIGISLEDTHDFVENARFKNSGTCKEWQCPTCKYRVKNLQRRVNEFGKPMWGCRQFCDTNDEAYFNGRACNRYQEGYNNGYTWF